MIYGTSRIQLVFQSIEKIKHLKISSRGKHIHKHMHPKEIIHQ
jgi:hypothetical protein